MPKEKREFDYYFFKTKEGEPAKNVMRTDKEFIGSAMHQTKGLLKHLGNQPMLILGKKYKAEYWIVDTMKCIVHVFVYECGGDI